MPCSCGNSTCCCSKICHCPEKLCTCISCFNLKENEVLKIKQETSLEPGEIMSTNYSSSDELPELTTILCSAENDVKLEGALMKPLQEFQNIDPSNLASSSVQAKSISQSDVDLESMSLLENDRQISFEKRNVNSEISREQEECYLKKDSPSISSVNNPTNCSLHFRSDDGNCDQRKKQNRARNKRKPPENALDVPGYMTNDFQFDQIEDVISEQNIDTTMTGNSAIRGNDLKRKSECKTTVCSVEDDMEFAGASMKPRHGFQNGIESSNLGSSSVHDKCISQSGLHLEDRPFPEKDCEITFEKRIANSEISHNQEECYRKRDSPSISSVVTIPTDDSLTFCSLDNNFQRKRRNGTQNKRKFAGSFLDEFNYLSNDLQSKQRHLVFRQNTNGTATDNNAVQGNLSKTGSLTSVPDLFVEMDPLPCTSSLNCFQNKGRQRQKKCRYVSSESQKLRNERHISQSHRRPCPSFKQESTFRLDKKELQTEKCKLEPEISTISNCSGPRPGNNSDADRLLEWLDHYISVKEHVDVQNTASEMNANFMPECSQVENNNSSSPLPKLECKPLEMLKDCEVVYQEGRSIIKKCTPRKSVNWKRDGLKNEQNSSSTRTRRRRWRRKRNQWKKETYNSTNNQKGAVKYLKKEAKSGNNVIKREIKKEKCFIKKEIKKEKCFIKKEIKKEKP